MSYLRKGDVVRMNPEMWDDDQKKRGGNKNMLVTHISGGGTVEATDADGEAWMAVDECWIRQKLEAEL